MGTDAGSNGSRTARFAKLLPHDPVARRALMLILLAMAALLTGFGFVANGQLVVGYVGATPGVALLSLLVAVGCGVPYLLVILWLDRNEREPLHLVVLALLWGAVLATGVSGLINGIFGLVTSAAFTDPVIAGQLTASFSAPVVEELSKGLGLVTLYALFRSELDSVLDGIIYGALVGLGFAVFENWLYYVRTEEVAGVVLLGLMRGVVGGVGTHVCFTAITGAGIGAFRVMRTGVLRWVVALAALGLAMFMHFSWNTFASLFLQSENVLVVVFVQLPVAVAVLQAPFLVGMGIVSFVATLHERWVVREHLKTEDLSEEERDELTSSIRRLLRTLRFGVALSPREWWRWRRRRALLVQLAFEKWHFDQECRHRSPDAATHARAVSELRRRLSS